MPKTGIVPIVEPEVLMDGNHSIDRCFDVTKNVQIAVFKALAEYNVKLELMILKPNMVISGKEAENQASIEEVAKKPLDYFVKPYRQPSRRLISYPADKATNSLPHI